MPTHTSRPRRIALLIGSTLLLTTGMLMSSAPAQAIPANPECNNFTQAFAASLGYVIYVGGPGNDTVVDNSGNSVWAWMGDGNDTVTTGSGSDMICGRDGNDTIDSGDGYDVVLGGKGNDTIDLGPGDFDFAIGGPDNDTIRGGEGEDGIYGDDQSPFSTAAGRDELDGGPDNDDLYGGPQGDTLLGNNGDDDLFGDDGDDDLKGGNDTDTADGGNDVDTCLAETLANCP